LDPDQRSFKLEKHSKVDWLEDPVPAQRLGTPSAKWVGSDVGAAWMPASCETLHELPQAPTLMLDMLEQGPTEWQRQQQPRWLPLTLCVQLHLGVRPTNIT
jgi:hypothetical protein